MTTPPVDTADPSEGPRVLVVQHEPGTPAGWFGDALEAAGCRLHLATPYDGSALPGLEGMSGLLVLGGAVDSWDDAAAPWLPATRDLVRDAEARGIPTLGICLGHQIAAHALGGRPGRNPAGRTLAIEGVGWLDEAADDPLFRDVRGATRAVHWNSDVVLDLPPGTQVVARSADGAVQAARLGRWVWGVQSHPEVDDSILRTWAEEEPDPDDDLRRLMSDLVQRMALEQAEVIDSWRPLATGFADLVARAGGPR